MNISKILQLSQPQCPKCYILLQNRLNIDVTNYENNTAVFIHPIVQLCQDSGLETKPFLLRNFVTDLDNNLSYNANLAPFKYKDGNGNYVEDHTVTEIPVKQDEGFSS